MKKNKSVQLIVILILSFLLSGCRKKLDDSPKISWQSGAVITYSYSGGVLSGFDAHLKFIVIDDNSGDIKFIANLDNDEKSLVTFVEAGLEYTLKVSCNISSTGKSGTIYVNSPSVSEPFKIGTSEYKVKIGVLTNAPQ